MGQLAITGTTPRCSAAGNSSPAETGFTPDFSVFGAGSMEHLPEENSRRAVSKSVDCVSPRKNTLNLKPAVTAVTAVQKFLGLPKNQNEESPTKVLATRPDPLNVPRPRASTVTERFSNAMNAFNQGTTPRETKEIMTQMHFEL